MCIFARWKNLFGTPGEGSHKTRFLGMALVDIVLTVVLALVISVWKKLNFFAVFIGLFILAQIFHLLFGVDTTVAKAIKNIA